MMNPSFDELQPIWTVSMAHGAGEGILRLTQRPFVWQMMLSIAHHHAPPSSSIVTGRWIEMSVSPVERPLPLDGAKCLCLCEFGIMHGGLCYDRTMRFSKWILFGFQFVLSLARPTIPMRLLQIFRKSFKLFFENSFSGDYAIKTPPRGMPSSQNLTSMSAIEAKTSYDFIML